MEAPDVSPFFLDAEEAPDVSPFLFETEVDLEVDADDESPFFFLLPFCFLELSLLLLSPSV